MAYITTEDVRKIRNKLKEEFGKTLKFGVRNSHKMKVIVTIKSGNIDFSDILEGEEYCDINHYYLDRYGKHENIFKKIVEIIKTAPDKEWFDNSDIQTDYFHVSYYYSIRVGEFDRPYMMTA